jgi:hypothetical protein
MEQKKWALAPEVAFGPFPATELSSRPERTRISYIAAPNNGRVCGFRSRKSQEVRQRH